MKFNAFTTFVMILLFSVALIPQNAKAQYEAEWTVAQSFWEYGYVYFDFNHDGSKDLTKHYFNSVTVYDGSNDWEPMWYVVAEDDDELLLWDVFELDDDDIAVFIASDLSGFATSRLVAYEPLADEQLWRTGDQRGYYSWIAVDNIDDDREKEIAWGINHWDEDDESYTSRFFVVDATDGQTEFTSPEFNGLMRGPYVGDIDNDDTVEILINLYNMTDSTSVLSAYSIDGGGNFAAEIEAPKSYSIGQNYPNPFNMQTNIPVQLNKTSRTEITVYDTNGRRITQLISGNLGAGMHTFHWNGLNDHGKPVSTGQYLYEVKINDTRYVKPMVLTK